TATSTGTQRRAAATRSACSKMRERAVSRKAAASTPPITGDTTQLATMAPITGQLMAEKPAETMPAPITAPTTEWAVATGAPLAVARLSQSAAANSADSMA